MNEVPLGFLFGALFVLILLSAFFSSSETGMMALNRYRLRHLVNSKHRAATLASRLLERPDRLIGVILIGNNFVNILASSIATVIAIRVLGEAGIVIATVLLTLVILIFAEVTPKTLAALHPERIAFPAAYLLRPLLILLFPVVWLINGITNNLLRLFGVNPNENQQDHLSTEEFRTLVHETPGIIPRKRKGMVLGILDLENVSVDDIMVPRQEIIGIDIDDDIETIISQLQDCQHTRLPIYKDDINNIIGVLHMRNAARFLATGTPSKADLLQEIAEPYFILENTPLHTQLFNFQKEKLRIAFVVDEYGDVEGLITLEDILEEIVGEFTTDMSDDSEGIKVQPDGSFLIDGSANIRDINRLLKWDLPSNGPKTLNGLITEYLETIPETKVCLKVGTYLIEILQIKDNVIKQAKVSLKKKR
ncbi:HlyC/CorC family transporter [Endozoicomonas sp. SM1973]|uniref:HlyC/CorC family transporter n=1 Tax=Spartinivicinus marinus TaxID=2994442 RepID=A0A853ICW6_9GAMM|nr:HlyC/CorC family transporter [Spartinivicinus marinus]MCX4025535.1 HlyC/CorC family transporter [Spartinivicinus marinus]NYZ65236.1 HlyC/CorC family transporter [Spartinivicinus marinus]